MNDANFCLYCTESIGGKDGISTSFNTGMFLKGDSMAWWGNGNYWGYHSSTAPSSANQYGVGYMQLDTAYDGVNYDDLNMLHGDLVVDFVARSGCVSNAQAFTTCNHTWSSSSVTRISVGPWSAGISWNSSSNGGRVSSPAWHDLADAVAGGEAAAGVDGR